MWQHNDLTLGLNMLSKCKIDQFYFTTGFPQPHALSLSFFLSLPLNLSIGSLRLIEVFDFVSQLWAASTNWDGKEHLSKLVKRRSTRERDENVWME